jgi:hypothetical protein
MADLIEKTIVWKDNGKEEIVLFGVGSFNDVLDDEVFYWADDMDELKSLEDKEGLEDFYIK